MGAIPVIDRWGAWGRGRRCFDGHLGDLQPDGPGRVDQLCFGKPDLGMPHGRFDEKNEVLAVYIRQPATGGQCRR